MFIDMNKSVYINQAVLNLRHYEGMPFRRLQTSGRVSRSLRHPFRPTGARKAADADTSDWKGMDASTAVLLYGMHSSLENAPSQALRRPHDAPSYNWNPEAAALHEGTRERKGLLVQRVRRDCHGKRIVRRALQPIAKRGSRFRSSNGNRRRASSRPVAIKWSGLATSDGTCWRIG